MDNKDNNRDILLSKLLSYQYPHVLQLEESFRHNNCILDASDTGTGKTYNALILCGILNLKPFIVCPKSVIHNWASTSKSLGVEILGISNYEKLKGGRYFTSNLEDVECPYMDRIINKEETMEKKYKQTLKETKKELEINKDEIIVKHIQETLTNNNLSRREEMQLYDPKNNKLFLVRLAEISAKNKLKQLEEEKQSEKNIVLVEEKIEEKIEEENNIKYDDDEVNFADIETKFEKEKKNLTDRQIKQTAVLGKSYSNKKESYEYNYIFYFPDDTCVIFDEAHRCKNYSSVTSKILLSCCNNSKKTLLLSATLIDKIECFKPFGVVFKLYPSIKQYKIWIRNQVKTKYNKEFLKPKYKDYTDEEKILVMIHNEIFPKMGSRLKIKELGDMFPSNQIIARCYKPNNPELVDNLYKEMNQAILELADKEKRSEALGKIMRARMKIEMQKVEIIIDLVEDELLTRSVVVFVNFRESMNFLCHHLKCDCVIHGEQTSDERKLAIDNFQNNKSHLLISMIQAGGVGISLHDINGRPRTSFISPSWNGTDVVQCMGRIHRAGALSPSRQMIVFMSDTYEEEICKNFSSKKTTIQGINDGDITPPNIPTETLEEIKKLDVNIDPDNDNVNLENNALKRPAKKIYKKVENKKGVLNAGLKKLPNDDKNPFAQLESKYQTKL